MQGSVDLVGIAAGLERLRRQYRRGRFGIHQVCNGEGIERCCGVEENLGLTGDFSARRNIGLRLGGVGYKSIPVAPYIIGQ